MDARSKLAEHTKAMSGAANSRVGALTLAVVLASAAQAAAQPAITGVSGSYAHKGSVTVTGTNFGTKPVAAPVVWDDASTSLLSKWTGGWPDCSANTNYNIAPRTPIRGITPPHSRVGKYIAGAHAEENGYCGGQNVILYKKFTNFTKPTVIYASWYQRADDAWVFNLGDPPDNNYKEMDWTTDPSPYGQSDFYVTYNPSPFNRTTPPSWAVSPGMGRSTTEWGLAGANPMNGTWTKVEAMFKFSAGSDGRIQIIDNGVVKVNYSGVTDTATGTVRTIGIGGYSRGRDVNNWRYFADVYLDTSWAHVILGNGPTLATSTRREVQIPSSWSNTSITVTANLAAFTEGQTAYLYVFDSAGQSNTNGFPVVLGGTASTKPAPPTNVRIIR
jgi:hypothetical protein